MRCSYSGETSSPDNRGGLSLWRIANTAIKDCQFFFLSFPLLRFNRCAAGGFSAAIVGTIVCIVSFKSVAESYIFLERRLF